MTKFIRVSLLACCVCLSSVGPLSAAEASREQVQATPIANQLADNPSPYLALHGNDPVAWQAWGPEVLARAKEENKPLFISSGYFSCHWCHVMQAESYQHEDVAKLLNDFFIPIKIDRELESALDGRLMNYAQATLKRGGWPLNVFMSPDGLPLYAVLYQPQPQFQGILLKLVEAWSKQSAKIRELALQEKELARFPDAEPKLDAVDVNNFVDNAVNQIMRRADGLQGGFGETNKFPSAPQLQFLLQQQQQFNSKSIDEFMRLTLDAMALHGMMDQLSGGFFRYSVDPSWEIPHFEKMLYDNANLASLYLNAGTVLQEPSYTAVARRTLDFMMDEMAGPDGALVAAFSAVDNEGVEGGHYLWTQDELSSILTADELQVFNAAWNMDRPNELEAGNHVRSLMSLDEVAKNIDSQADSVRNLLISAQQKVLAARAKRILPVDDKFLAGWNGLALTAFSEAAMKLNDERYKQQAQRIEQFLMNQLWDGETLTRGIAKGQKVGSAAIEDYAYVAQGLLAFAKLSGNTKHYQQATAVFEQGWQRFYKNNAWSAADGSLLPAEDGEEIMTEASSASPAAVLINTGLELANYLGDTASAKTLRLRSLSALNRGYARVQQGGFWYATQLAAMHNAVTTP